MSNDINNRHSPNVEIVFLTSQEKKPLPTHVPVMCRVPSTALCENIQTVSKDRLSTFIKSCTTKELKNIDNALRVSLGISDSPSVGGGIEETAPQKSTPTEVERDLYKSLYEQILDKLMGGNNR